MQIVTRAQARASGLKRYFTGTPCKHGHIAERLVVNGSCYECTRLKHFKEYHANIEEERRKKKIRRDSDPNNAAKKRARRAERDPEYAERSNAWRAAHEARRCAIENGESQFFTGVPCHKGHVAKRFTNGGKCVECNRLSCLARPRMVATPSGKTFVVRRTLVQIREAAAKRDAAREEKVRWWHLLKASRQAALANGDKTYFGRPCPKGHTGKRYTKNGGCVDCFATIASSDAKKAYDANYVKLNRERIAERTRRYHERTAEKRLARVREWAAKNRDKVRAIKISYKARRRQQESGGDPTSAIHAWEKSAPKVCYWCGVKCPKLYHIDHYVPLSKGGKHEVRNLVIACRKCNLKKNARDPYDFARELGRLF